MNREYECQTECVFNTEEDYLAFVNKLSWEEIRLFKKFLESPKKFPAILTYELSPITDYYDGYYTYPEDVEAERIEKLKQKAEFLLSFIYHLESEHGFCLKKEVEESLEVFKDAEDSKIKEIAEKFVGL